MDVNPLVVLGMVPMMSKIMDHKLNGFNYMDWSKTIRFYLWSINKDDHLTDDPPKDDLKLT